MPPEATSGPEDLLEGLRADEIAAETEVAAAGEAQLRRNVQAGAPESGEAAPTEPAADGQPEQQQADWEADQRFGGDPAKVYKSYRELESKLGSRDEQTAAELEELRRFRQQAEPVLLAQHQPEPEPMTALPDGTPILSQEQLMSLRDEDPAQYADFMIAYHTFAVEQKMERRLTQIVGPLRAAQVDTATQATLDHLNHDLGDEVIARNAPLITKLITEDREHYAHPQHGMRRLREAIIAAEWDAANGGQQQRQQPRNAQGQFAPADTYVEGGSGAQPPQSGSTTPIDPEEKALLDSLTYQRPVDEAGIPLPRF